MMEARFPYTIFWLNGKQRADRENRRGNLRFHIKKYCNIQTRIKIDLQTKVFSEYRNERCNYREMITCE